MATPTTPPATPVVYYEPNLSLDGNKVPCSVCIRPTTQLLGGFSVVAICSDDCRTKYRGQWSQCELNPLESRFTFNDRRLRYDTDKLKKNEHGEVCVIVCDLNDGDEYNSPREILLPVEQVKKANQS